MKQRLQRFIKEVTNGGSYSEFGRMMGWSPQYMNRLLNDGAIGIRPVIAILERFPELNARWFLLGTGTMLDTETVLNAHIRKALRLEPLVDFMGEANRSAFSHGSVAFSEEDILSWEAKKAEADAQKAAEQAAE